MSNLLAGTSYLHGSQNLQLMLLSILLAIITCGMVLQIARTGREFDLLSHRRIALASGSVAMLTGLWVSYFISVLSFEPDTPVTYHTGQLALSILPAWAASWILLIQFSRPRLSIRPLIFSGTIIALCLQFMLYMILAAIQTTPPLHHPPEALILSFALTFALTLLILRIPSHLNQSKLSLPWQLIFSSIIMGVALSGMYYGSMASVRITGASPEIVYDTDLSGTTLLGLKLCLVALCITVLSTAAISLMRYRQVFQKMEKSESHMRAMVETAVDGIITINAHGIIQAFNPSAERLFGWKAHEVIGRNVKMLMPDPDRSQHDDYLKRYLTSGIPKIIGSGREVNGLHKEGHHLPMRLAVGRVDLSGEPLFIGFVTDITEHRTLESSLREAATRAEQASSTKTAFLANMSHEIRTPMNAIIGFTELLLKSSLTPLQRSHLTTVRQSARSLLGLLNDILDTTKLETTRVELESLNFSLREIASQVVSSLSLSAESKGLHLSFHYPETMCPYFRGDPLRIQQIITNLIGNAIKFTERGTVRLEFESLSEPIQTAEANAQATPGRHMVHIRVKDSGIGMAPEHLKNIFEPFTQADASISRRFGGTGLGTTIARQLVELMGGTIHVESELGKGTSFDIHLPLIEGNKPETALTAQEQHSLPPMRILIVDDVPQNLELLTLILEPGGHQITTARDGSEAVQQYLSQQFDIILMDVHMPNIDGLEAVRRIRQHESVEALPRTPIIALTASVMKSDRRAAWNAGMDGFAVKPFDTPKLMSEMLRVLSTDTPGNAQNTRSETPDAPAMLIDWAAGSKLWGSTQRLSQAIEQFLAEAPRQHPLPDATDTAVNWQRTLHSLHGIRGATGNLALPRLSRLAGELENQIRNGTTEHLMPRLTELKTMLAAVADELKAAQVAVEPTPSCQPSPALDIQAHVRQLMRSLERNELNDEALAHIEAYLCTRNAQAYHTALSNAINRFEFEHAIRLLEQYQTDPALFQQSPHETTEKYPPNPAAG